MHNALRHALALQFAQAIETSAQLEDAQEPTLASQLTRGIIAYFQSRWQTPQTPPAWKVGQEALENVLEEGQERLQQAEKEPWLKLILGTAAVFNALLLQQDSAWGGMQLVVQGRSWLQETLVLYDDMTDAHLGLGLLYFVGADLPAPLLLLWGGDGGKPSTSEAIRHLQRAAEAGQFSQDVARTFLAQLYAQEKRYDEAIALGQALQSSFPENGYFALLTGRSQCADSRDAACVATLEKLAGQYAASPDVLAARDDRFDLYYTWGLALNELSQDEQAFHAFRQAINQDASVTKDATLWAKYHLARLYERRGQPKTARQLYQTLLRGRNVADLHEQVQQRLTRLR
jgi:tetratricopeptide (TPR) repeat protein